MSRLDGALRDLKEMDSLAAGDSLVHRLHPLCKLLVTLAYILMTVSFDPYDLSGLFPMILYPVLAFQLSDVPVRTCFYKLRFVLPLVLLVGLFNPFFDRTPVLTVGSLTLTGGMLSMTTLMCKGVFSLMASFLLAATTRIEAICAALRRLRVPSMLVTLLLLTWRYIGLMIEEAGIMTEAYRLRAPGQRGIHHSAWGSFLGQLLLRSMDRAEELYAGMRLRGFHGEFYYESAGKARGTDLLWLFCWAAVFAALRLIPAASLLGGLFVR